MKVYDTSQQKELLFSFTVSINKYLQHFSKLNIIVKLKELISNLQFQSKYDILLILVIFSLFTDTIDRHRGRSVFHDPPETLSDPDTAGWFGQGVSDEGAPITWYRSHDCR